MIKNIAQYRPIISRVLKSFKNFLHLLAGEPLINSAVNDIEQAHINLSFLEQNAHLWSVDELLEIKTICAAIEETTQSFIDEEITKGNLTRPETRK